MWLYKQTSQRWLTNCPHLASSLRGTESHTCPHILYLHLTHPCVSLVQFYFCPADGRGPKKPNTTCCVQPPKNRFLYQLYHGNTTNAHNCIPCVSLLPLLPFARVCRLAYSYYALCLRPNVLSCRCRTEHRATSLLTICNGKTQHIECGRCQKCVSRTTRFHLNLSHITHAVAILFDRKWFSCVSQFYHPGSITILI